MDQNTMNQKIEFLKARRHILLKKTKSGWISDRTQAQLFNTLHRDHGVKEMEIKKRSENWLTIKATNFDGVVVIDSAILLD